MIMEVKSWVFIVFAPILGVVMVFYSLVLQL